jgi:hypothetical protein
MPAYGAQKQCARKILKHGDDNKTESGIFRAVQDFNYNKRKHVSRTQRNRERCGNTARHQHRCIFGLGG